MTPPVLIGTYIAPAVRKGDRVFCLYRDCDCVVSSWTNARISWPRVGVRGQQGGSGLWIDETLLRAIRTESATALKYWFGVGPHAVWRWRKAFGIGHTGTEESKHLHQELSVRGAEGIKAKVWTAKERASKRKITRGRKIPDRWAGKHWTAKMDARLGTVGDKVFALDLGTRRSAFRSRWVRLGFPAVDDGRKQRGIGPSLAELDERLPSGIAQSPCG